MDIQPIFRCAVGIDLHLALICVWIIIAEPGVEPVVHRREFGGFQRDRRAMANWIASFKPDIVVMESTGIYWKSPYATLEKVGIHAQVVNARQVNQAIAMSALSSAKSLGPQYEPPVSLRAVSGGVPDNATFALNSASRHLFLISGRYVAEYHLIFLS